MTNSAARSPQPDVQSIPFADRTLPRVLAATVAAHPGKTFIEFEHDSMTYREFDEATNRFAHFANSLDAPAGRVAIMLPNCLEFVVGWFGIAKAGAVYVPINNQYRGDILRYQLDKADVTHILIHVDYLERLAEVIRELSKITTVVTVGSRSAPAAELCGKLEDSVKVVDFDRYQEFSSQPPSNEVRFDDHHCIAFTSGTTGPSKGVLSTQCHVVSFSLDWIKLNQYTSEDTTYCPMPLFHALGSWLGVLSAVICSGRIVLARKFSASTYWADVRRHNASVALGIFSMVPLLLKQPSRSTDADNSARVYYLGQHNVEFEDRFGVRIVNAFGATETGAVTYTPFDESAPPGSCGRPHSEKYDVRIVDDAGNEVAVGEVGEIVVRARHPHTLMEGYYGDPEATEKAMSGGWFHTGDNARRDEEGWYYFVDRKKDSIRVRGENISSFELESVVHRHPEVLECAAVPSPSEFGEDEVMLFVVRAPGSDLTHESLHQYCIDNMPAFWVPSIIEFIAVMPHTPTQKIMKYRLKDGAVQGDRRAFVRRPVRDVVERN